MAIFGQAQPRNTNRVGSWWQRILWIVGSLAVVLVAGVFSIIARQPKSSRGMHFVTSIEIPPAAGLLSGTDYAIVHDHALFVAYSSADTLLKIDTKTSLLQAFATGLKGIHGAAFSQDPGLVFTSDGGAGQVAVLQMPQAILVKRVAAGMDPDGIVFDRKLNIAYTGNGGSGSATLIPADDLEHPTTISLGGSPEFPQVDEATGLIYQPLEDKNEVVVVDPMRKQVVSRFAVSPCEGPKGSAIDSVRQVLFIGCSNRMLVVMDLVNGQILSSIPIGRFVDVVGWDAGLRRIYTANSMGSMTVIEQSEQGTYRVLDTVRTLAGGHTLAVDPDTHRVYVVCSRLRGAQVLVYEPSSAS